MPKVTFKNLLDDKSKFREISKRNLLSAVYEYARTSSDSEIYHTILNQKITILVNDKVIHPDNWHMFELKKKDKVIITPTLEGGTSGGWLQIGIGAALMTLAVVNPAWLPFAAKYVFAAGAALALGGASQLLFAPDLPSMPSISGDKQTQTYNWSGVKTVAKADSPIPIVYGTHPVGGNIVSIFTESYGEDSYLCMLLALCEGEIDGICQEADHTQVCSTSNQSLRDTTYKDPAIKIDDQPLRVYNDVEWWYRKGTNTRTAGSNYDPYDPTVQNKIPHFDGARIQFDDGRELTVDGIKYTTTKEVDMVTVNVRAPALFDSSGGSIVSATASYKIEFWNDSETEENAHAYAIKKWSPSVSGTRDGGTMADASSYCICTTYRDDEYKYGDIQDPTYTVKILNNNFRNFTEGERRVEYTINIEIYDSSGDLIESKSITQSMRRTATRPNYGEGEFGDWEYGETTHNYTQFLVNDYSVKLTHNVAANDIFTISSVQSGDTESLHLTGKTKTGKGNSITINFLDEGTTGANGKDIYTIKLSRTDDGKSSSMLKENNLILKSVVEVVQGEFIYPNTALLGLRIKATGQLSGSPPNVVTLVRGTKIPVPDLSGTDEAFDDHFWSVDNNRWEYDGGARTWDGSWTTEYSNNAMLCVRDLMLNTRYGLGRYINSTDLYSTGITTAIKECHKEYDPTEPDHLDWWDEGGDTFDKNIRSLGTSSSENISIDNSAKTITFSGAWLYSFYIKLSAPLIIGREYTFSITLSSLSSNCTVGFRISAGQMIKHFTYVGASSNKGNGTHSLTWTCTHSRLHLLKLTVERYAGSSTNLSGVIEDISITDTSNKLHYHTWNGVLESGQSAPTALIEMCDSFRCWPVWYNGQFNFVIDTDDTPIHTLTTSNMTSFSQSFSPISEIPYKLIGQYTDEDTNYDMRSLIARSTSTTLTKLNERTVGLKGITNRRKAERELVWKLNKVTNCTHMVNFKCGLDMIHATAGDIVYVQHDLPSWGQGGRLLDYNSTNASITIDAAYTFTATPDSAASYLIRYQTDADSFVVATVEASGLSLNDSKQTISVKSWPATDPCDDAVYAIGKSPSYIKKFRLISAARFKENEVEVAALEHLSSLYSDEPTITVVEDNYSQLPNPLEIPGEPINVSVGCTSITEGIGFILKADPPQGDSNVIEIIVQMSDANDLQYETIATIPVERGGTKYIDNNLELDHTYYFRFFCRTKFKSSRTVDVVYELKKDNYLLSPPTGIHIKGANPNDHTFDGRDVTIMWDPVGSSYSTSFSVSGYKVEVYHTSVSSANLLRTEYVSSEEYTYSLDNNLEDCAQATLYSSLIFILYTRNVAMIESVGSTYFPVSNSIPAVVSGLSASSIVGGVNFSWNKSTETDLKCYHYRTKVGSGSWSSWTDLEDNTLTRTLTASEIGAYTSRATIYIEVKAKDVYNQLSATAATANAKANTVSDNIFALVASKSAGSGTLSELYDGTRDSGGVTI